MRSPPDDAIYRTLSQVLLAGRLAPGTQLVETRIAMIFDVSRERVRKVLHRLGHERLLELIPNRGAFVSNPTLAQAREIYEARRIVEGGIVARLAGRLGAAQLEQLRMHGALEQAALRRGDRARSIQLSGEFHTLLARFAASSFVERELQELVSRTSMLVAFFEPAAASDCACEEHDAIVAALQRGDVNDAVRCMHVHLSMIETRLQPRGLPEALGSPEAEIERVWKAEQRHAPRGSVKTGRSGDAARVPRGARARAG